MKLTNSFHSIPIKLFGAFLFCLNASSSVFVVEAYAYFDPLVLCVPSDASSSNICAYREVYGPSPVCKEDENNEWTCSYEGSYSTVFRFVHGLKNGTDVTSLEDMSEYSLNFYTSVTWDNVTTCVANVNSAQCTSCTKCSEEKEDFSVDCTNINGGKSTECKPLLPVFYPLSKPPVAEDLRAADCWDMVHSACECTKGAIGLKCAKDQMQLCLLSSEKKNKSKEMKKVIQKFKKSVKDCSN